jgi:membrane associated rhomboid family serine protease
MWFLLWGRQGMPVWIAAAAALTAGVLFGLTMAWYMRWSARKRAIPARRDFDV